MKNEKREQVQAEATEAMVVNKFTGVYDIAPRVGKTKVVIDALRHLPEGKRTLVTVPYNPILDSWEAEIVKWGLEESKRPLIVNQRNLHKVEEKFDLIISDEIHTLSDNQMEILPSLMKEKGRMMGITGSLSKSTEKILNQNFGLNVVYTYSIEQAVRDRIISNYHITVIFLPLDAKDRVIEVGTKKKPAMTTELQAYNLFTARFELFKRKSWVNPALKNVKMSWAGKRANLIYTAPKKIELAKRIIDQHDRCLIFTARTAVADELGEVAYHGKSEGDELDRFFDGKENKLAVVDMVNMGITFPNLKTGIVHQLKSSEEMAIQKILRMCNLEQDNDVAEIIVLAYMNTVDQEWVIKALEPFEPSKISYENYKRYIYENQY